MKEKKLPRSFFARDTHVVARAMLGKVLVRRCGRARISGRITEVESYVGADDVASHAARGRTPRTEIMFGPAGYAYIYFIYGMYYCCNITTARREFPAAILIRSLEPLTGILHMQRARQRDALRDLTTGPGKLTQALGITTTLNHEDITRSTQLYLVDDGYRVTPRDIIATTRIGVAYAGESAALPWRYYLKDSAYVSRR